MILNAAEKAEIAEPVSFLSKQIIDHLWHAFMFLPANMQGSKHNKYKVWDSPDFNICEAVISISHHSVAARSQMNKSVTLKIKKKRPKKNQTQQAQIFRDTLDFYSSSKKQQKSVNSRWCLKGFQREAISIQNALERHHHNLFCEAKVAAKQSCALLLLNKWTIIAACSSTSVFLAHFPFS